MHRIEGKIKKGTTGITAQCPNILRELDQRHPSAPSNRNDAKAKDRHTVGPDPSQMIPLYNIYQFIGNVEGSYRPTPRKGPVQRQEDQRGSPQAPLQEADRKIEEQTLRITSQFPTRIPIARALGRTDAQSDTKRDSRGSQCADRCQCLRIET